MTDWPDEVVKHLQGAIPMAAMADTHQEAAEIIIQALGGERVWVHKETGAVILGPPQSPPHFSEALLIPLEGGDVGH